MIFFLFFFYFFLSSHDISLCMIQLASLRSYGRRGTRCGTTWDQSWALYYSLFVVTNNVKLFVVTNNVKLFVIRYSLLE